MKRKHPDDTLKLKGKKAPLLEKLLRNQKLGKELDNEVATPGQVGQANHMKTNSAVKIKILLLEFPQPSPSSPPCY